MEEKELLKMLAYRANNIIMKGHFSGDDITEAADVMKLCHDIWNILNNDAKNKTD
jgi:hypothetical protein